MSKLLEEQSIVLFTGSGKFMFFVFCFFLFCLFVCLFVFFCFCFCFCFFLIIIGYWERNVIRYNKNVYKLNVFYL